MSAAGMRKHHGRNAVPDCLTLLVSSCRTRPLQANTEEGRSHCPERAWLQQEGGADKEAAGRRAGSVHVPVPAPAGPAAGSVHVHVSEPAGCRAGRVHGDGGTVEGLGAGLKEACFYAEPPLRLETCFIWSLKAAFDLPPEPQLSADWFLLPGA